MFKAYLFLIMCAVIIFWLVSAINLFVNLKFNYMNRKTAKKIYDILWALIMIIGFISVVIRW